MLRSMEQRLLRQQAMREERALAADDEGAGLKLKEAARVLNVSYSTARRLLRNEPNVYPLRTPGSKRPIVRIPRSVIERLLRRSANPRQP